jgi:hypothetical protein
LFLLPHTLLSAELLDEIDMAQLPSEEAVEESAKVALAADIVCWWWW